MSDHPIYFVLPANEYFTRCMTHIPFLSFFNNPFISSSADTDKDVIWVSKMPRGSFDLSQKKICLGLILTFGHKNDIDIWSQNRNQTSRSFMLDLIASKTLVGGDTVVTFVASLLSKWIQANPLIGFFTHGCQKLARVSKLKNVMLKWHGG